MATAKFNIGKAYSSFSLIKKTIWLVLLGTGLSQSVNAQPEPLQSADWQHDSTVAVSLTTQPTLLNGVYLYGKTPQPEQAQAEYFVFRVQDKKVVGAFYMPQSSFDCFRGDLKAKQLDLTVVTSYEQQAYDHTLSLNAYHPIAQVSNNDHRMLEACQSDHSLASLR